MAGGVFGVRRRLFFYFFRLIEDSPCGTLALIFQAVGGSAIRLRPITSMNPGQHRRPQPIPGMNSFHATSLCERWFFPP